MSVRALVSIPIQNLLYCTVFFKDPWIFSEQKQCDPSEIFQLALSHIPKPSLPVGIKKISRRKDGPDLGFADRKRARSETRMGGREKIGEGHGGDVREVERGRREDDSWLWNETFLSI